MNNYYIDSSVSTSGDGSYASPFKQFSDFFALTSVTHPITLNVRNGLVYNGGAVDNNYLLYNTTSDTSYLKTYGEGSAPVIVARDDQNERCIRWGKVRNFISEKIILAGTMVANPLGNVNPCMIEGDNNTNVWLNDWEFHGIGGKQQAWAPAFWFAAVNFVLGNAGYFGMNNPKFVNTARGVWVMGISDVPSGTTDNNTDRYYAYGVRINNPSFINVGGDGVIMSNCASINNPKSYDIDDVIADKNYSGIVNPSYTSFRSDMQGNASVAMWFSNCNKCFFYKPQVNGSMGAKYGIDKQSVDFDILCHDCLIDGAYSRNASGLLLTSNYASQVPAKPSGTSDFDWYYTAGYGNKNNTIRNSISYNDGTEATRPKMLIQGFTYNLMVENCIFIDMVTTDANLMTIYGGFTLTNSVYCAVLSNVTFYAPNAKTIRMLGSGSTSGTDSLVSATNCNLFASSSVTPTWPTNGLMTNNTSVDPLFYNCPASSPSFNMAFKIFM